MKIFVLNLRTIIKQLTDFKKKVPMNTPRIPKIFNVKASQQLVTETKIQKKNKNFKKKKTCKTISKKKRESSDDSSPKYQGNI
jgi:predicted Holliday junction resolvase-like endonuclease